MCVCESVNLTMQRHADTEVHSGDRVHTPLEEISKKVPQRTEARVREQNQMAEIVQSSTVAVVWRQL